MMLKHAGKLLIYLTGISIGLSHFGLANNAISILLLAIGIVILLSIKDVLTDIIYGFIILVGKPFREGDAIHIPSMSEDDWAWVSKIGSRDTHLRTRDNRTMVVPNATMGTDQVIDYRYRIPPIESTLICILDTARTSISFRLCWSRRYVALIRYWQTSQWM